jgi:hypothetical protein
MILLVSRAPISQKDVDWVSQETGIELHLVACLEDASHRMRGASCPVAVMDAGWLETDPKGVESLLAKNPALVPVFPNLAVCGPERLGNL